MSAPDFLVIGAQKCGTTTLFEDLRSHPQVRLAPKENKHLLRSQDVGRLPNGGHGLVVGEVATDYAMLPMIDAVSLARHAFDRIKVVYIVRNPIDRLISHHHNYVAAKAMDPDINRAVQEEPPLLDNSRYATQVAPWINTFGRHAVLVIRFEDYMADRQAGFDALAEFLGIFRHLLPEPERVHNAANDKRVASGWWWKLWKTRAYQVLRRLLPGGLRRRLVRLVLPEPPIRPPGPTAETRALLVDELEPEVESLAALLGTEPFWDLRSSAKHEEEERT